MRIDRKIKTKIKNEVKIKSENSIQSLLEGKLEEAKKNMEYIRLSTEITSKYEKKWKFFWAVIIGSICISLIGFAFSLHVRSTPVSFEVLVDGLTLHLDKEWESETPLFADYFSINHLKQISTSLKSSLKDSENPFSMTLQGTKIKLMNLALSKEAEVSFEAQKGQLSIYAKNSQIAGSFLIKKGQVEIDGLEPLSDPDSFYYFKSNRVGPYSSPVKLIFKNRVFWEFFGLNPNKMEFKMEHPPGSGNFESLIHGGKLLLFDTNKEIELRKHESFYVGIKNTRRLNLKETENKITVSFEGRISKLIGGPEGRQRNLKPTYLEYFYENQKVALLWGAFVFIFGILWSIKNTIFK